MQQVEAMRTRIQQQRREGSDCVFPDMKWSHIHHSQGPSALSSSLYIFHWSICSNSCKTNIKTMMYSINCSTYVLIGSWWLSKIPWIWAVLDGFLPILPPPVSIVQNVHLRSCSEPNSYTILGKRGLCSFTPPATSIQFTSYENDIINYVDQ